MNCQPSSFCVIDRQPSDRLEQGKTLNVHDARKNRVCIKMLRDIVVHRKALAGERILTNFAIWFRTGARWMDSGEAAERYSGYS